VSADDHALHGMAASLLGKHYLVAGDLAVRRVADHTPGPAANTGRHPQRALAALTTALRQAEATTAAAAHATMVHTDPRPAVLHDLAMAQRALGRDDAAVASLRRAVELAARAQPPQLVAYYTLVHAETLAHASAGGGDGEVSALLAAAEAAAHAEHDALMLAAVAQMQAQLRAGERPTLP
jgi:hypothetical protein